MSRWDARSRLSHHGMFESRKAQRQRISEAIAKTGRGYASHLEGARKVLEKEQKDGLVLWNWQTQETATLLSEQCTTQSHTSMFPKDGV